MKRIAIAIVAGIGVALLTWLVGCFINGEWYSFMQTGPWPDNATITRTLMAAYGLGAATLTWVMVDVRR